MALGEKDVNDAIRIHFKNLREGLIFELGEELARLFYREITYDPDSWGYVAVKDNSIVGTAACSLNPKKLNAKFYRRNIFSILRYVPFEIIKHSKLLKHILETLRLRKEETPALVFLIVDEKYKQIGIGSVLVDAVMDEFKCRGVKRFLVEFNEGNAAENFYKKKGFTLFSDYKIFDRNRRVYEYRISQ